MAGTNTGGEDWGDLAKQDQGPQVRSKELHEGHTAAFFWVQKQNLVEARGRRLGEKYHSETSMSSFTQVTSANLKGPDIEAWILHQAYPELHEHAVLLYNTEGDEDNLDEALDSTGPIIRRAAAVQRRYRIETRYMATERLLVLSAPSEIAKRVAKDLADAGVIVASSVSIDLRKLNEHHNIKDTVAAWADGSDHIRTRAAFGSKVLTDQQGLSGDLRSIRVLVDLGHTVRGAMISRDGRITILGHDGTLDTIIDLFRDLKSLVGRPPPSQSAL